MGHYCSLLCGIWGGCKGKEYICKGGKGEEGYTYTIYERCGNRSMCMQAIVQHSLFLRLRISFLCSLVATSTEISSCSSPIQKYTMHNVQCMQQRATCNCCLQLQRISSSLAVLPSLPLILSPSLPPSPPLFFSSSLPPSLPHGT